MDMVISNFVYEKEGSRHKKTMRYRSAFPQNRIFTWDDVKFLRKGQYILMHMFYVDNIFVYHPLPYVKMMYYLNVDLYRYYIGREDQSVNEQVMIRRMQTLSILRY